jgi:hypothetical protein
MKRGIDERGPIAAWLIRARAGFSDPEADHTWTADEFLVALKAEATKAPARTTYARWESGAARPSDRSLAPIIAFYAERKVAGPEARPTVAPAPDLATALSALAKSNEALVAELTAWRTERQALVTRVTDLEALVREQGASLDALGTAPRGALDAPPATA